jgi:hypothetical protein
MNEQTFANVRLNRGKVQLGILILCFLGLILLAQPSTHSQVGEQPQQRALATSSDGGTFIEIDHPLGVKGTHAWGINPQGDIVGSYDDEDNVRHGFLLHDGQFTTIDNPNGGHGPPGPGGVKQGTTLYDINALGDIVGRYINEDNIAHSFLSRHGVFYPVDVPDAQGTQADSINERGDIVGDYADSNFHVHGFLLHDGTYVTINAPHPGSGRGSGTHAFGINYKQEIVLFTEPSTTIAHSFVLRHGQLTPLNDPKGVGGTALQGINDNGVIVGDWFDGNNVDHGLVFCHGVFTTHDDPHAGTANGQGGGLKKINLRGDSVGWYTASNNIDHGFLFVPSDTERDNCSSSTN